MRKGYTVYRVDYVTGKKEAIGSILERRSGNRGVERTLLALLVEARSLFGRTLEDAFCIVLDSPRDSRGLPMDETEGEPHLVHTGDPPDFQVARFGQPVEKGGDNG
ncbi:MAG TPA: hypothetical protein VK944_08265 [Candidatus Limnocylindria bacterium]|nr:hypothetical protein [Candidatus Limnocylindria bacterium]